jgi:hypothetical protein
MRMAVETFRSPLAGAERLDTHLAEGRPVALQTSAFWLPYFPAEMRFHFNVHNLIVFGQEGDEYLISDPVFEEPVRCHRSDLLKARFAKGVMAPRGRLYYPATPPREPDWGNLLPRAIRRNCRLMLGPVPFAGVRGIRRLARAVEALDPRGDGKAARLFIGHLVRMQEEIGTGGAGFRFIYAAFLQEAAGLLARPGLEARAGDLVTIGDAWREMALAAARMIRDRDPLDPPRLGSMLRALADREEAFFRALLRET